MREIALYYVNTDSIAGLDIDELMSRERLRRADALGGVKRLSSKAAEVCLCAALMDAGEMPPARYEYAADGSPVLSAPRGVYMSLAHTGSMAACALSEIPVGIDVEAVRRVARGMAQRIAAAWEAVPEGHCAAIRLWTQKEAVIKLRPEGGGTMRSFGVRYPDVVTEDGTVAATLQTLWADGCWQTVAAAEPFGLRAVKLERGDVELMLARARNLRGFCTHDA
ncbi:MAG: hypothetical protein Q4B99_06820 [Clostridia bacterium]|nr:hypothetical protein [Clostridia bacterium]